MSTSNLNQPNTPPTYGSNNNNNNNNSKKLLTIAAIAIATLLGTNIFLMVSKYKTSQTLDTTIRELDTKEQAMAELETQFNDATAQLEQLKGQNTELNSKIDEQLKQLDEQKGKISELIRVKGDLKAARNEIAALVRHKDEAVIEIANLKEKVTQLSTENTKLTDNNKQLEENLTQTKSKLDEESTAKAALISEKTQLESSNKKLTGKVDIASAVKVNTISCEPVKVKSSGKESSTSKSKKVDKIKICFKTEANDVVEAGEEKFFISIIDPQGATLAIEDLGSGVSKDKKRDSEFRYTTVATCNYTNSPTDVCGAWQPGQNFIKGLYHVEVYNKGFKVGESEFKLK